MKARFKNIIFDVDGTLVDSARGIINSLQRTMEIFKIPSLPKEELQKLIGTSFFSAVKEKFQFTQNKAEEFVAAYRKIYSESEIDNFDEYSGIKELVISLKESGAIITIASNKPEVFINRIVKKMGIFNCFDRICGIPLEPSTLTKIEILKRAIINPTSAVLIGDTKFDLLAAKFHNIHFIGVLYGFGSKEELSEAEMLAKDTSAIMKFVIE